jgi:hypothetical protein
MNQCVLTRVSLVAGCLACLSNVASADYESAVLALNPTHYWRLNETTQGSAIDAVGGLNGTHQGFFDTGLGEVGVPGPPVSGLEPGNLAFGANNFASVGLGPGTALAASTMTVAGWFSENGSEGGDRFFTNNQTDPNTSFQIFFGGGFGDVAANIGIGLNPAVNGFPSSGLPSGSGVGNFHLPDSTKRVKDGEWHHIVASRNGNNIENVILVIDGVNYGVDTWRDSTDTWGTTGSDAQIATRTPPDGGPAQQAINGSVDEIAVWLNRQLTVEESISLYNAAIGVAGPDGDFNGDGNVDGGDFLKWERDFPTLSADDLAKWESNFGTTALSAAATSVPEPVTLAQLLIVVAGLATSRSQRKG